MPELKHSVASERLAIPQGGVLWGVQMFRMGCLDGGNPASKLKGELGPHLTLEQSQGA